MMRKVTVQTKGYITDKNEEREETVTSEKLCQ